MKDNRHNKKLGKVGEDLAAELLSGRGLEIIRRNFRTKDGEIDLIAKDGNITVFIEVKTRLSKAAGTAAEALDEKKCNKIRHMAEIFMSAENANESPVRFDVVTFDNDGGQWKACWIKKAF